MQEGPPRNVATAGYIIIPKWNYNASTSKDISKQFRNEIRKLYFHFLLPRGSSPSAEERAQTRNDRNKIDDFVSLVHFPASYRKPDDSGLTTLVVPKEEITMLGLMDINIAWIDLPVHPDHGKYILPPCLTRNEIVHDYVAEGGNVKDLGEKLKCESSTSMQLADP